MEYWTFIILAIFLAGYLVFKKRKIDLFLVSGVSGLLFSTPLFFGVVSLGSYSLYMPIESELYLTFIMLFFALFVCLIVNDYSSLPTRKCVADSLTEIKIVRTIGYIVFGLWLIFLSFILYKFGTEIFYGISKRQLMESLGLRLTFLMSLSILSSVCLAVSGKYIGRVIAGAVLLIMLVIGQRLPIVLTGISLLLVYGRHGEARRLFSRNILLYFGALVGSIVTISLLKPVYSSFKGGGVVHMIDYMKTINIFDLIRKGAEFTSTQYQYNVIVHEQFKTDGLHILRGPLSLFPVPRSWYTTSSDEFNTLFQSALFPDLKYGMAYNPFAEFYAGAGLVGVAMYILIYIGSIYFINSFLRKSQFSVVVLISIIGALVAFYSYRNSLAVSCALIRNVFWPYIGVFICCRCYLLFGRK